MEYAPSMPKSGTSVSLQKPAAARRDPSAAALRAYFRIADAWGLDANQQRVLLGSPAASTFYKWKKDRAGNLSRDVLERISYVLGIYKALQILFSDPRNADEWITRPNTAGPFGGRSALERMLSGNVGDLYVVRQYLDGERG